MSSKAQGLSLNTIIIAAIVLIVLLVLIGLLTGYFGNKWKPAFGKLTDTSCAGQGGTQKAACNVYEKETFADDLQQNQKCCTSEFKVCTDLTKVSNGKTGKGGCFASCGDPIPEGDAWCAKYGSAPKCCVATWN